MKAGNSSSNIHDIAVVGMAVRVPGANTLERYWHNILHGVDSLSRLSGPELWRSGVGCRQLANPQFVRSKPLIRDADYFDSGFFDMSAFEAERTDPGNRLFLECAWDALEDGGVVPGSPGIVAGVYGGIERWYHDANLVDYSSNGPDGVYSIEDLGKILPNHLGNAIEYFTTRVSYKLNLTGPSFTVQAACATSLVAIHLATQAIRRGECNLAVVGGACVELPLVGGYMSTVDGMLSASGMLRPFDSRADGTIFGSGAGAVVLRPLEAAIQDGSPIYGVIKGTSIANDGNSGDKESFIAPSPIGQKAVVEGALSDAGVSPRSIGYVEAHGTATELGDPIEVNSIAEVFRRQTDDTQYCGLGSVKANIGHLRAGAGIVSLIKTCLSLSNQIVPPQTNYRNHNTRIDLKETPFFINSKPLPWEKKDFPRRAGVSSFGFGGSNAHVIAEEYVATRGGNCQSENHNEYLLVFSAHTKSALRRRIADVAIYLDENPNISLAKLAYSLAEGRSPMSYRCCILLSESTLSPMSLLLEKPLAEGFTRRQYIEPVYLFPGQGAQRPGMGQKIYKSEKLYRDIVDYCANKLEVLLGFDIRTLIHIDEDLEDDTLIQELQQTSNTQPALFVVEYALARLFLSRGVKPCAMIGHSIGEIVAACLANVFSLDDALLLVASRARLMQMCESGGMLAVFLPESELLEILPQGLEIASVNSPQICVVSGRQEQIDNFAESMTSKNIISRPVKTSHAFHSWMMEPALPEFSKVLHDIDLKAPDQLVISNTTGKPLTDAQATNPEYWAGHIRHGVRFSDSVNYVVENLVDAPVFVELGPGTGLSDLVNQHDSKFSTVAVMETGSAKETPKEIHPSIVAMASLWCGGAQINWQQWYADLIPEKFNLPAYPYERQRLWLERGESETRPLSSLPQYCPGWKLEELDSSSIISEQRPWVILSDKFRVG